MTDPFTTLGIEPGFEIDLESLELRHRELSRALHPDRYAGRPASERREALGRAIEVNEAWRALKDPIRRAEALLHKIGIVTIEGSEPPQDPEFLMQIMEYREELSTLRRERKPEKLARMISEISERETRAGQALAQAFRGANGNGVEPRTVHKHLGELRYYRRFLDEARAIEDDA